MATCKKFSKRELLEIRQKCYYDYFDSVKNLPFPKKIDSSNIAEINRNHRYPAITRDVICKKEILHSESRFTTIEFKDLACDRRYKVSRNPYDCSKEYMKIAVEPSEGYSNIDEYLSTNSILELDPLYFVHDPNDFVAIRNIAPQGVPVMDINKRMITFIKERKPYPTYKEVIDYFVSLINGRDFYIVETKIAYEGYREYDRWYGTVIQASYRYYNFIPVDPIYSGSF